MTSGSRCRGDLVEELVEADVFLRSSGWVSISFGLGDADGVDDHEVVLASASGVTAWRSCRG
jgi:hypothetical protein